MSVPAVMVLSMLRRETELVNGSGSFEDIGISFPTGRVRCANRGSLCEPWFAKRTLQNYPCQSTPLAGSSSFGSMRVLAFIISSQVTARPSYAAVRPRMQVSVLSALCWALLMYFLDTTLWQKLLMLATAPVL